MEGVVLPRADVVRGRRELPQLSFGSLSSLSIYLLIEVELPSRSIKPPEAECTGRFGQGQMLRELEERGGDETTVESAAADHQRLPKD